MRNVTLLALTLLISACGKPYPPSVDKAWVRLPAVAGRPGAAYFTLTGGSADATLIAVATAAARRAELHESMAAGMRPIAGVTVAADARAAFAPGGRHVMLIDLDPRLTAGASVPLTLRFADGRMLAASAAVVGAADPAP